MTLEDYILMSLVNGTIILFVVGLLSIILFKFNKRSAEKSVSYNVIKESIDRVTTLSKDINCLVEGRKKYEDKAHNIESILQILIESIQEHNASISGNSDRITLLSRLIGGK